MKVLTVISVTFIPLNFMAGVFGMNFESFPWKARHAFELFALACLAIMFVMVGWFRRHDWI